MRVLVAGSAGSGKTTQAKLLAEYLKVPLVGTGEILRKLAQAATPTAKKVRKILDEGYLVNDQFMAEIVQKRLSEDDCQKGFIMDGYPRTVSQIEIFNPGFDKVFYLKMSDDLVIARLLKRARVDDTPQLIQIRLKDYHRLTRPILDYYGNLGILVEVDGDQTIEQIQNQIRKVL